MTNLTKEPKKECPFDGRESPPCDICKLENPIKTALLRIALMLDVTNRRINDVYSHIDKYTGDFEKEISDLLKDI